MTWRLLYVRPGGEKRVMNALAEVRTRHGEKLEVYMPVEKVWRGLGARRAEHERPLIRSILFASVPDELLPIVTHTDGVHRLVLAHPADTLKLAAFIGELRQKEAGGAWDKTIRKPLKVGGKARVTSGPWSGLVFQIAGMENARRIQLVTNLFGREAKLTMSATKLEPVEETTTPRHLVAA